MNRFLKPFTRAFAGGLFSAAAACGAAGHGETIDDMTAEANLVFHGTVEEIEYALSRPSGPERVRIPYTFVTYRVVDILHGADPGPTLTLRFIGGLDLNTESYMMASNAPQFDLDDEDILFVRDNTTRMVPLVGAKDGRIRIIEEQAYDEWGHALILGDDNRLHAGKRHLLEDVMTTHVGGQVFVRDLGPEAIHAPSNAADADTLKVAIRRSSLLLPIVGEGVMQADASQPFDGPDMTPAAPPAASADGAIAAEDEEAAIVERPMHRRKRQ